jgi:hypothetical protein
MRTGSIFFAALLVLCACQSRGVRSASGKPSAAADIAAMRALLERYSKSGHYIVTTYEALPRQFVFADGVTTTISHSGGFADYFDDGAPENVVDYMETSVHEVYHAYSSTMGYQLLVDTKSLRGKGAEALYVGGDPLLVMYNETFPAREMDATFPNDAKTNRYPVYVSPSKDLQSTQQEGVFGLLDEFTAYYHSSRTVVDLWPWVRDEAPKSEKLITNYVVRLHSLWVPYAEFTFYILHYLRYAKEKHPKIYQELIANQSFRRAFQATEQTYAALLTEAAALEPIVYEFARSHGVDVSLQDGQLMYAGSVFPVRDAGYPALLRLLSSEPYKKIRAELK